MEKQPTTFILNGNTYRLLPTDSDAIRQIPKADRQQLIELLEAIQQQDRLSQAAVQQAATKTSQTAAITTAKTNPASATTATTPTQQTPPERLGEGDIDDLMTRLIMEEKGNKKPQLTPQTIYLWAGGILAVIIFLIYLF